MMQHVTANDEQPFGDMNGPLAYWGPDARAPRAATLSLAEQCVLLRLRDRLERADPATVTLSQALSALLDTPQAVLAAV